MAFTGLRPGLFLPRALSLPGRGYTIPRIILGQEGGETHANSQKGSGNRLVSRSA